MPDFQRQRNWTVFDRTNLEGALAREGVGKIATPPRRRWWERQRQGGGPASLFGVLGAAVIPFIIRNTLAIACILAALMLVLSLLWAYFSSNGLADVAAVVAFAALALAWHLAVDPWPDDGS